jgi:metacaspase-1
MFLLTFSGHGTVRLGERGPDEAWCLEDGLVFDDDLTTLLAAFKPGVRVWVISDSCYSGTMVDPVEAPFSRPGGLAPSQTEGLAPRLAGRGAPPPVKLLRNADTSQPLVEQAAIKSMLWRQQGSPTPPEARTARGGALSIKAAVLCLAACLDKNQTPRIPPARPELPRKTFTRTLLNLWDDGHYPKSCWDLCHDAIASWVPTIERRPQPYWVGSGKPFGGQTPAFPIFVPPLTGRVRPPRLGPKLIRRPARSAGRV